MYIYQKKTMSSGSSTTFTLSRMQSISTSNSKIEKSQCSWSFPGHLTCVTDKFMSCATRKVRKSYPVVDSHTFSLLTERSKLVKCHVSHLDLLMCFLCNVLLSIGYQIPESTYVCRNAILSVRDDNRAAFMSSMEVEVWENALRTQTRRSSSSSLLTGPAFNHAFMAQEY
jgi:hypothetical protein